MTKFDEPIVNKNHSFILTYKIKCIDPIIKRLHRTPIYKVILHYLAILAYLITSTHLIYT